MHRYPLICVVLLLVASTTAKADLIGSWTHTASNPTVTAGGPATITWGFVADGTAVTGFDEGSSPSNLISFMDGLYGTGSGALSERPWFSIFLNSFTRWSQVSGLDFSHEPNDDGTPTQNAINLSTPPTGSLGVRPDVRIGGHSIDGQGVSNVLAYNYFPNHSDMVIDTDNAVFFGQTANQSLSFRNTLMHEIGHGFGLDHRESNNTEFLMEPSITTSFDGPQFDDIWAVQRGYGDVREKNGGNDTSATATSLGTLSAGQTKSIGDDASDAVVAATDVDFVSIDGTSDTDFFSFEITTESVLDLILNPLGPTYQKGIQDGLQSAFNAKSLNDLILDLRDSNGATLLNSDSTTAGNSESIEDVMLSPGTYIAQIRGKQDITQFYQLQLRVANVPEPSSGLLLALFGLLFGVRRTRVSSRL